MARNHEKGRTNVVLSVGELANLFSKSHMTIIRWIDSGKLEGFRLGEESAGNRRVYTDAFRYFVSLNPKYQYALEKYDAGKYNNAYPSRDRSAERRASEAATKDRHPAFTAGWAAEHREHSERAGFAPTGDDPAQGGGVTDLIGNLSPKFADRIARLSADEIRRLREAIARAVAARGCVTEPELTNGE